MKVIMPGMTLFTFSISGVNWRKVIICLMNLPQSRLQLGRNSVKSVTNQSERDFQIDIST